MQPFVMNKICAIFMMGLVFVAATHAWAADNLHGLFQDKCRMCHTSYEGLAKIKLTLKSGRLVGLYTDHDIAEFMTGHGRVTESEARAITERLTRLRTGLETGGSKGRHKRMRGGRRER